MTKRIIESQTVYTGHLHADVLPTTFSHLDPANLLMAEIVCKTWQNASISHNELWECVAYRKGIFVNRSLPIRIQVIQSFGPYCEAARKIFCNELKHIPKDMSPTMEKLMIDQVISKMDKTQIDPLKALIKHLSIDSYLYKPILKGTRQIIDCIKMIPVWVETGTLTINEDLLNYFLNNQGWVQHFNERELFLLTDLNICIELFFTDEGEFDCSSHKLYISAIEKAILSIAEYILHFTEKPSLNLIKDLYLMTATIQSSFAWHKIGAIYFANSHTLNRLLGNLKDNAWEEAFAQFMQEKNAPVNIEIEYPPFLKDILQKMDKTELQELINLLPNSNLQSDNPYIIYMHKQIQKDTTKFLLSLNKSLS